MKEAKSVQRIYFEVKNLDDIKIKQATISHYFKKFYDSLSLMELPNLLTVLDDIFADFLTYEGKQPTGDIFLGDFYCFHIKIKEFLFLCFDWEYGLKDQAHAFKTKVRDLVKEGFHDEATVNEKFERILEKGLLGASLYGNSDRSGDYFYFLRKIQYFILFHIELIAIENQQIKPTLKSA